MQKDRTVPNVFGRHWHDFKAAYNSLLTLNFLNTILLVAVIAISILVPILFYILIQNLSVYADKINMGRNINVYLEEGMTAERAAIIRDSFAKDSRIKCVELITADEALEEFSEALGIELKDYQTTKNNPLPHVIVVTPNENFLSDGSLEKISNEIKSNREVEIVQLDKQWFNRLQSIITFLNALTLTIAFILLISVLLTVLSSIATRVAMHRGEIEVMKLVGATNAFICRPYFYIGFWLGLLGSLMAIWFSSLSVMLSDNLVNGIAKAYGTKIEIAGLSIVEMFVVIAIASFVAGIVSCICAYLKIAKIEPIE